MLLENHLNDDRSCPINQHRSVIMPFNYRWFTANCRGALWRVF